MASTSLKLRRRKQLKSRPPNHVFYKTFSRSVYLDGYKVKVCSRFQIGKIFNVPVSTVIKWDEAGVLPQPLMYLSMGAKQYPVWLAAQIRCLVLVVNQLVKESYVTIPWSKLPAHLAMLRQGYEEVFASFEKRAGYVEVDEDEVKSDKYGVFILED